MEGDRLYDLWHSPYRLWQSSGACRGDAHTFFSSLVRDQERAKERCKKSCPVIRECLAYALLANEDIGVWGGKTESERKAISRLGAAIPGYDNQLQRILDDFVVSITNVPKPKGIFDDFGTILERAS